MLFKFHLYVQRHYNRTYTVTPLPFYDLTAYGNNLEEIKNDLKEALAEKVQNMNPMQLHQLEFDGARYLHKAQVEIRPTDPKKRNKRREKIKLVFSLLVTPKEDGQLYVQVPKLGFSGPTFYVYNRAEMQSEAQVELASWLDGSTLQNLLSHQHARSETLEPFEIEVAIKKVKERQEPDDRFGTFGEDKDNFWALKEIGLNMTAQAAEGKFRKAYRCEDRVEDIMKTLMATRNNSVLLVGPSEVGKTAIIHEIIRRIERGDCPDPLRERQVWMLSPDRIIAGAQYIGTWEERINNIVDECRKKQHILYIEDLPGLLEIGKWSKSDHSVALALRPHVASGEVVLLAEGLPERVMMGDSQGPSFMNLFRRVELQPMNEEETLSVLSNVAKDLEREHNVRILPEANEATVLLSRRFIPYRAFPGKSLRLLEETVNDAVRNAAGNQSYQDKPFRRSRIVATLDRHNIIATFAKVSGMPEFIVNDRSRMDLEEVERYFHERIVGQDDAVQTVVNLVATIKAGLNDPHKPLGTLFFIGPTGVGKTQMAKTIATYLFGTSERLLRYDMSEYRDLDGVARLIGAFGKEGELTTKVREQPFSVVLLDEFEKAAPQIYDIFLQVLGEGRLTDSAGRTTYFHNSIIIMTSNLGAGAKSFGGLGFSLGDELEATAEVSEALREHYRKKVEEYFRPEFVNRIDHLCIFGHLGHVALRHIASRELGDILSRDGITRRNLLVEIEDSVIDIVLQEGYSPVYGARPLKREIERLVVSPMARELAQRSVGDTNLIRVGVDLGTGKILLKNVPIDEAGQSSTVTLSGGLQDASSKKMRMDTAQLVEGFAMVRRKLADWREDSRFKDMVNEKAELLAQSSAPDFWQDGDAARTKLGRFYFLDRLTRRLKQLYEKSEYLEDLAILVNRERDARYQPDLARDYEELYRDSAYLDIELLTAHLPHRNQAMMLITPMGASLQKAATPKEEWMRRLANMYLTWAERKGYDRDIYVLAPNAQAPGKASFQEITAGNFKQMIRKFEDFAHTDEIALMFEGSNVFGFLKGERGLHRLEKDMGTDEMVQVRVFAIPDSTNVKDWLRDYHEIKVDIAEGRRNAPPMEKHTVIRVYSLEKQGERFIRDMRTNTRTTQVKDVVEKGRLDEFILTYLNQVEGGVGWEDRYPPTFPY